MSRIKKLLRMSVLTGILSFVMAVAPQAIAQNVVSHETATQLGKAAEASNAAAYVLGFVCMLCLGTAAWSINKRDDTISEIRNLSDSIRASNKTMEDKINHDTKAIESINVLGDGIKELAKKPCALDNNSVIHLIRGKLEDNK
jgi:beta-lactamase regulating signal transducer with metallopeptidase domain